MLLAEVYSGSKLTAYRGKLEEARSPELSGICHNALTPLSHRGCGQIISQKYKTHDARGRNHVLHSLLIHRLEPRRGRSASTRGLGLAFLHEETSLLNGRNGHASPSNVPHMTDPHITDNICSAR